MNGKQWIFLSLLSSSVLLNVQANDDNKPSTIAQINPVVMDTGVEGETALGLEYLFKGDLLSKNLDSLDNSELIVTDPRIGSISLSYDIRGTLAISKEKNPKDFQEFGLNMQMLNSTDKGTVKGGAFVKYETDQDFDNKQFRYGLGATYGKFGLLAENDFFSVDMDYGQIDPDNDIEREALLGENGLSTYDRLDAEFLYMYPLKGKTIDNVELNYRYFIEMDAPDTIKSNQLDKHELATIRLGLKNNLYLAYSEGKLPFDKQDDQLLQIGISHNFE